MRSLVTCRLDVGQRSGRSLGALLIVLAALLSASPALSAVDHDAILRDRLLDVRELLARRQAYRLMLTEKIERFSGRLDRLQAEREVALEALADQEDRARAHERELDRLMPRLLPRLKGLDQLRKEGARAIAGLAKMERHADIEARARSHLMVTQAPSIDHMRRASTAVRLLRRVSNAMTVRHRDLDFQIPLLAASANRLEHQQSQLQRRRDAAVRDLAGLTIDIERLTAEEHRLARSMIARRLEAKDGEMSDVGDARTTLPNRRGLGKAAIGSAHVRGVALGQLQPRPIARPLEAPSSVSGVAAAKATGRDTASLSAKGRKTALLTGQAGRERQWGGSVASRAMPEFGGTLTVRGRASQLPKDQPLVPSLETIDFADAAGNRPEFQISARPRQPVAAPKEGRIVFAGDFRSYGLLLIIEHGSGYHTLLWGFSWLDAEVGDNVHAGQVIGFAQDGSFPKLHVELRRNGQPVSPEVWLAASNSGVKG